MPRSPELSKPYEKRFAIVAHPRSGSTWLNLLLDGHPSITCFREIFSRKLFVIDASGQRRMSRRFMADILSQGLGAEGIFQELYRQNPSGDIHGFLYHHIHLRPPVFEEVFKKIAKVIFITRLTTGCYVSKMHAKQAKKWLLFPGEDTINSEFLPRFDEPLTINIKQARSVLRGEKKRVALRHDILHRLNIKHLHVEYDILRAYRDEELSRIQSFLEVPVMALADRSVKLHAKGYSFITNLDEVNAKLGDEFGYLDSNEDID